MQLSNRIVLLALAGFMCLMVVAGDPEPTPQEGEQKSDQVDSQNSSSSKSPEALKQEIVEDQKKVQESCQNLKNMLANEYKGDTAIEMASESCEKLLKILQESMTEMSQPPPKDS